MFYNCGFDAGASIKHKHMQVIPYSSFDHCQLPVEEVAGKQWLKDNKPALFELKQFAGIKHVFLALRETTGPAELEAFVKDQLSFFGPGDYNLVLMRRFLLLVMRSKDAFDRPGKPKLAFNALAFAGTFAVKSDEALAHLAELTPLAVIKEIAATF